MNDIKLLIADDHAIVRTGLVALLESSGGITVVGEADDGDTAVRMVRKCRPDIVVMDILMPGKNGIAATAEIKEKFPETKVLILTTSTVSDDLSAALTAGADGAVTKSTANRTLLAAVRSVAEGKRFVSPEISKMIANDPPLPELTDRQRIILDAMARGKGNKEIAAQLDIKTDSVRQHIIAIFSKLGAVNRAEAVAIALKKHLVNI